MNAFEAGLLVKAYEINAEIEMMKVANKVKEMHDEELVFLPEHFSYFACELERISKELMRG